MAMKTSWFSVTWVVFYCFVVLFYRAYGEGEDDRPTDINRWCDTTPHPEPCRCLMGRDPHRFRPKDQAEFRTMTIQATLEQALHAANNTKELGPHCRGKRKKMAWVDCDKLVDDTVFQLNSTLQGLQSNATNFADADAQTWLSTALTNIRTCQSGPVELNVSDFISPVVARHNLTQLISNCLAVNGVLVQNQENGNNTDAYPSWVSPGDRRLLSSRTLAAKANVVVAQDGSGQFKSIQSAINYATAKRAKDQRVIIYIKRGVYAENIVITNTMDNVMLVGDGLKYTIITGDRSVGGGFTTLT